MSTKDLINRSKAEKKQTFFQRNKYIFLAFAFPFVLMTVVFATKGVSPFGDKQILVTDLWHQYYPFLVDMQDKLQSGGSLFYTWSVGLGSNYLSLMSYYLASPVNFLSVLVPAEFLREFLTFSVILKMSLASCFFAIFLRYTYKKNDLSIAFFSVLFGLCAFFMGYYWNVIWLDTVAITPLVVMGIVAVLREGKFKVYVISLALAIMANYYIGLFLCYFTLIVYIVYTICNWKGFKRFGITLMQMGGYSLLALCITAVMTIPAFFGLQNTYSVDNNFESTFRINRIGDVEPTHDLMGVLQSFGKILTNTLAFIEPNPKESNLMPNIYCGVIAIVLAFIFFASSKIKIKEKLASGGVLIFIILSCIIRHLDFIWHGFHFTNMIPYRFSFLFSFVLVCLAFRAYHVLERKSFWDALIAALFMGLILLLAVDVQEPRVIWGSAIIIVLILALVMLYSKKIIPKNALSVALCLLVFTEMCFNGFIGVGKVTVTTTDDYPRGGENTATVISQMKEMEADTVDRWRAEMTTTQTLNDGALNKYSGISLFSSMANDSITNFTQDMGLASWASGNRYIYIENSPVTNLFLNLKYMISRNGEYNNTEYFTEVASSEQVKLLKNEAYLPMGFMTNSDLLDYKLSETWSDPENPFDKQNEFVKLATGGTEDIYTPVEVINQGHTDYEKFKVDKMKYGEYTITTVETGLKPHLKYNYEAPEDGMYFGYMSAPSCDNMTLMINDETKGTFAIKRPYIMCLGYYNKGDKISFYCDLEENASGKVKVYCNYLKADVFDSMYKKLGESTLNATEVTDTKLKGEIDVKEDGLFYTSIPYEKGWSAKVDGEPVEITPVGDAMVAFKLTAGKHTVELNYVPDGFVIGLTATLLGILVLVGLGVLQNRRRKRLLLQNATKTYSKMYTQNYVADENDVKNAGEQPEPAQDTEAEKTDSDGIIESDE